MLNKVCGVATVSHRPPTHNTCGTVVILPEVKKKKKREKVPDEHRARGQPSSTSTPCSVSYTLGEMGQIMTGERKLSTVMQVIAASLSLCEISTVMIHCFVSSLHSFSSSLDHHCSLYRTLTEQEGEGPTLNDMFTKNK